MEDREGREEEENGMEVTPVCIFKFSLYSLYLTSCWYIYVHFYFARNRQSRNKQT